MFNIFLTVFFSTLAFAFLEPYFFIGYLISIALFGLYQAIFMANAGGAWDNAKKIVEIELKEKGTPLHAATVVGDTVGDPFKDTSSVAMNPVIKFTTLFGLLAVELAVTLAATQGRGLSRVPVRALLRDLARSSSGARSTACASRPEPPRWARPPTAARWPAASNAGAERKSAVALRFLATAVGALPVPAAAWLGRRLGDVAYATLGRRRRLALANLTQAFPDLPPAARRGIARRSFQHLGMAVGEGCFVLHRPLARVTEQIRVSGLDHVRTALDRDGRGLVLSAHLGNWELLTLAPALTGLPLTVVARALDLPSLHAWADRLRRTTGVEVIDKRHALRPVLEALKRGRLVGVLLDQNASRREGVFVPFFGRLASTSRSIAVLALRTRTPIIPVFARRLAPGRHEITIHPELPLPTAGDEGAIRTLTASCTAAIEAAIRATPDQWLWCHDRWRTRPPGEGRQSPVA